MGAHDLVGCVWASTIANKMAVIATETNFAIFTIKNIGRDHVPASVINTLKQFAVDIAKSTLSSRQIENTTNGRGHM